MYEGLFVYGDSSFCIVNIDVAVNVGYPKHPVSSVNSATGPDNKAEGSREIDRHRRGDKQSALRRRLAGQATASTDEKGEEEEEGKGAEQKTTGGRGERGRRGDDTTTSTSAGDNESMQTGPTQPWTYDVDLTLQLYAYQYVLRICQCYAALY